MTAQLRPQISDYSHLEPLPDPPPREPDMRQDQRIYDFRSILRLSLSHRDDVLIAGGGYLRHQASNASEQLAPDCVVAFGVNSSGIVERNGYVISEVGKPPDLVLEVASRSTGRRDYTVKREGYAGYGVREYWRFDPTGGRYHDAALAGDALVEGQYEPLPVTRDPDGLLWGYSEVLDLELCWDRGEFRLRDHDTKQFLSTPEEERSLREAAEAGREAAESGRQAAESGRQAAESERQTAESERQAAEGRAESERQARLVAEERIRLLEAEIARRPSP